MNTNPHNVPSFTPRAPNSTAPNSTAPAISAQQAAQIIPTLTMTPNSSSAVNRRGVPPEFFLKLPCTHFNSRHGCKYKTQEICGFLHDKVNTTDMQPLPFRIESSIKHVGDWRCPQPHCKYRNFARRKVCALCHYAPPEDVLAQCQAVKHSPSPSTAGQTTTPTTSAQPVPPVVSQATSASRQPAAQNKTTYAPNPPNSHASSDSTKFYPSRHPHQPVMYYPQYPQQPVSFYPKLPPPPTHGDSGYFYQDDDADEDTQFEEDEPDILGEAHPIYQYDRSDTYLHQDDRISQAQPFYPMMHPSMTDASFPSTMTMSALYPDQSASSTPPTWPRLKPLSQNDSDDDEKPKKDGNNIKKVDHDDAELKLKGGRTQKHQPRGQDATTRQLQLQVEALTTRLVNLETTHFEMRKKIEERNFMQTSKINELVQYNQRISSEMNSMMATNARMQVMINTLHSEMDGLKSMMARGSTNDSTRGDHKLSPNGENVDVNLPTDSNHALNDALMSMQLSPTTTSSPVDQETMRKLLEEQQSLHHHMHLQSATLQHVNSGSSSSSFGPLSAPHHHNQQLNHNHLSLGPLINNHTNYLLLPPPPFSSDITVDTLFSDHLTPKTNSTSLMQ